MSLHSGLSVYRPVIDSKESVYNALRQANGDSVAIMIGSAFYSPGKRW